LADLLDRVADRESQGTASTWRFSPVSVRRALDAGHTAEELLADLRAAAGSGLPQPLEYLINDVARRHGEVTVSPLVCAICCPEPALLTEIRMHRRLRRLNLRELAPTVLASTEPVAETLKALRDAGYVPIGHDESGVPLIERAPRRRATPSTPSTHSPPRAAAGSRRPAKSATKRPPPSPSEDGPEELARRLHGVRSSPHAGASTAVDRLEGLTPQLSITERRLLTHALDTGEPVRIDYVNGDGNPSSRVIENAELDAPFLSAWCRLRNDQRIFRLGRITAVAPGT
jgi:hypothetical protein